MLLDQLLLPILNLLHQCHASLLHRSELSQVSVLFAHEHVPALLLGTALRGLKVGEEVVVVVDLHLYNWLFNLFKRLRGISRMEVTVLWVHSRKDVNQPLPVNVLGIFDRQRQMLKLRIVLHPLYDGFQDELLHGRSWQRQSADISVHGHPVGPVLDP